MTTKSRARSTTTSRRQRRGRLLLADLDQLVADEHPIYVINTSGNDSVSLVLFNNPSNGDVIPHQVPAQQVPWCLTDYLSREIIAGSTDLRQYIADGNLSVLDPDFAAEMAEDPRVARVLSRLRKQKKKSKGSTGGNRARVSRKVISLDPRVESIMARLTASERKTKAAQQAAIDALELIADHLDQPEFAYIMQVAPDCELVTRWAVEEMGSDTEGMEIDSSRRAPGRKAKPSRSTAKPDKAAKSSSQVRDEDGMKLNTSQKDRLRDIRVKLSRR